MKNKYTVKEYIYKYYENKQINLANELGVSKQILTQWIQKDYFVLDHILCTRIKILKKEKASLNKKETRQELRNQ